MARTQKVATKIVKTKLEKVVTNQPKAKVAKANKVKLSVPLYSLSGQQVGSLNLPETLFAQKVNKTLLSQAMRVYLNNQKSHFSNTKTRGEVQGSTKKIYKQKGTGRARHGSKRAPIFVHGGIALGPKFRKVVLDLPKKMKRAALISALSQKLSDKQIIGIDNLADVSGKTSQIFQLLNKLSAKSLLMVMGEKNEKAFRAVRNISGVDTLVTDQLNAYQIIRHDRLMFTRDALSNLEKRLSGEEKL